MARQTLFTLPPLVGLTLAGATLAAETPVAVSPGGASKLVLIESRCPTFSWSEIEGAKSYELVIYRLAVEGEEVGPVVRQRIPGSALSWTPSLDSCLARGGRYAWSVRAAGGNRASEWSAPSLLEVAAGPSQLELEAALAAVREVLGREAASAGLAAQEGAQTSSGSSAAAAAGGEGPAPRGGPPAPTQLYVDGNVDATSFSGDGSMVTSLDPANLSSAVPLGQGGTGATDAAAARTALDVAQGPHTVNTNAETFCGTGELLDGDGNCVVRTGLNELTGCMEDHVPVFKSGSWGCGLPMQMVAEPIPLSTSTQFTVDCPGELTILGGGLGATPGSQFHDCHLDLSNDWIRLSGLQQQTSSVTCEVDYPTGSEYGGNCSCLAFCR